MMFRVSIIDENPIMRPPMIMTSNSSLFIRAGLARKAKNDFSPLGESVG